MDNFELKSFLGSLNSVRSGTRISRIIKSIEKSLFVGLKKKTKTLDCCCFFYVSLLQECSEKKMLWNTIIQCMLP